MDVNDIEDEDCCKETEWEPSHVINSQVRISNFLINFFVLPLGITCSK